MMISEEITTFLAENRCEIDRVTIAPEEGEMIISFVPGDGLSIDRHTGSTKILIPAIVVKSIYQERIILAFDRFDTPKGGEYFMDDLGTIQKAAFYYSSRYPIYKVEVE